MRKNSLKNCWEMSNNASLTFSFNVLVPCCNYGKPRDSPAFQGILDLFVGIGLATGPAVGGALYDVSFWLSCLSPIGAGCRQLRIPWGGGGGALRRRCLPVSGRNPRSSVSPGSARCYLSFITSPLEPRFRPSITSTPPSWMYTAAPL